MRCAFAASLLILSAATVAPAFAQDATLVAIAVTPSADGVLTVPVGGYAAFAVAVGNFSKTFVQVIPSVVAVRPVSQEPLPVAAFICHTVPTTGQCVQFEVGRLASIPPGQVATFSVFVHARDAIDFSPGTARIVATFNGQYPIHIPGAQYTSAGVAVRTVP